MSEYNTVGKLPPDILQSSVLKLSGAPRSEVLIGPGLGEDAALVRWGSEPYLVAASDPVVGASQGAGRLLVHINANDVACKGGDPAWFIVTLIVPAGKGVEYIRHVMEEVHSVCASLGIAIVGGHTELTDRYDHPILVGTMMGPSRFDLRIENIRAGDVILMTRHAGLEGMSILAHDRPELLRPFMSEAELEEVRSWQDDLSVLKEARLLRDLARYMHDPTEGGLLGGLLEIRASCGLDLELNVRDVAASPLTEKAAEALGFDPLRLISSGVLVAVLPPEKAEEAQKRLSDAVPRGAKPVEARIIGRFVSRGPEENKCKEKMQESPDLHEELWRILNLE